MSYFEDNIEPYIGMVPELHCIVNKDHWGTKDDEIMHINDMTLEHLDNTVKYLRRKGRTIPTLMLERWTAEFTIEDTQ